MRRSLVPWFPPPTPTPTSDSERLVDCSTSAAAPNGLAAYNGDDFGMVDDTLPPCEAMPQPSLLTIMLLFGAAIVINSG